MNLLPLITHTVPVRRGARPVCAPRRGRAGILQSVLTFGARRDADLASGLLGCGGIGARHAAAVARSERRACSSSPAAGAIREQVRRIRRALRRRARSPICVACWRSAARPAHRRAAALRTCRPGRAAVAAGIHLLVEKPIALDLTRAQSMVDAAASAGVVAACGFMYRFGDAVERWDAARRGGRNRPRRASSPASSIATRCMPIGGANARNPAARWSSS